MPLLYHWRRETYQADLDAGLAYHLNQSNPLLHDIDRGDSLWAFTRAPDGAYVMAAELVVHAKTRNPEGYRYGPYRIYGDLERSRYFRVPGQAEASDLLRSLSVRARARLLGQSFQGRAAVRRLTAQDDAVIRAWCVDLPSEPRACLLPEALLESAYSQGDAHSVGRLLDDPRHGLAPQRRAWLRAALERNRGLVVQLRALYAGACQLCGEDPDERYRHPICEAHHLQWLARGGSDATHNLILLCPNHHRAVHACDAQLDHGRRAMDFGRRVEAVVLDRQLWTPSAPGPR